MNMNLASFINRDPEVIMTTAPKMTKTATSIKLSETQQNGLVNNDFLNDNNITTNIEVIGLQLYSAASVIVGVMVIFMLCALWRMYKKKNCIKNCHFICIKNCRYGEDITKTPERSVAYTARGEPRVETIPMDWACLIRLANQLAFNSAVAQMQSRSCTSLNTENTNVADAETGERE